MNQQEKTMARFNPQKLKLISVDGESIMAPESSTILDMVPPIVNAITTFDSEGKQTLIPRSEFNRQLPEGFTTHLTHVEKG
jgi:hypothetical protein